MNNREQRFGVRVEFEMPLHWYSIDVSGGKTTAHEGTSVDISAMGAQFATREAPAVDETVVLQLRTDHPPLDVAAPARVVRVTRAAGGYRCGVRFVPLDAAMRVALGKFVIAVIRDRDAA